MTLSAWKTGNGDWGTSPTGPTAAGDFALKSDGAGGTLITTTAPPPISPLVRPF